MSRETQVSRGSGIARARKAQVGLGTAIALESVMTTGTVLKLDVDYVHPADPAEAERQPRRCFDLLEPAHRGVITAFARLGVEPLVLPTRAGYRYRARAARGTPLHEGLVRAGRAPEWGSRARGLALETGDEQAHRGAGRYLQLVVHDVLREAPRGASVPVRLGDLPTPGAGPCIRLDLDAYADGLGRHRMSEPEEAGSAVIPDVTGKDWLRAYEWSGLAAFHERMDRAPESLEWVQRTADPADVESLPSCASSVLRSPSPGLLQPRHLRTVCLSLWSLGWHPRTIAGLIRSRYDAPLDWGGYWTHHDAASRADFFVRLYCAAAAEGLEDGGTFGCQALSQHALCPADGCGYDLDVLFARRRRFQARDEAHS